MKTYKFEAYFTGDPLVRVEFSYNETTMFHDVGGRVTSAPITDEQLSALISATSQRTNARRLDFCRSIWSATRLNSEDAQPAMEEQLCGTTLDGRLWPSCAENASSLNVSPRPGFWPWHHARAH